ncbi:MAG: IdeS/Mac family cysteine endopeptidase [Treponema sp.]
MIKKHKLIAFAILLDLLFTTCKGNYTQKTKGVVTEDNKVINVKSITLIPNESKISLVKGTTHQLKVEVKPENATDKKLSYVSDKTEIASVNDTGLITAHKVGTANITITAGGISKNLIVTVVEAHIPAKEISISPTQNPISLVNGTSYQLNVQVKPENATDKKLSYVSDKTEIASVNDTGLITAHKVGTANITIAVGSISKTIEVIVTVAHIPVISIEFTKQLPEQPIELFVGDEYKLEAKVTPENATNKKINFATSNGSIAGLSGEEKNIVKANGEGEATITITSDDNHSITQEVRFKVKIRPIPSIKIKQAPEKCKNNACKTTIVIEKINGGLKYKPVILGGGSKWVEISSEVSSTETEDEIQLNVSENKTVWERTAYIKFKNNLNRFIKGEDNKDLEVKLIQEKNENPKVEVKWVYGIGEPSDDERKPVEIPHSSPKQYHKMPYVFHWHETENTKFFNTRKMGPTGSNAGKYPDHSQCWAKSSSNMLHWWFEQNKENVKKYIEKKGITKEDNPELYEMYNPYYRRELPDNQENIKSSIANEFREKCPNSTNGSWIYLGLRWYLYGLKDFAKDKTYSPALFKDIFGKGEENDPAVARTTPTKKEFEEVLKDALLNPDSKKAVGVHVHDEGKYGHAITLWGAAFDEEKNVIAIYVCDNNDRENRIFTYGIYYKSDIYADDPEGIVRVYPYLINYNINKKLDKYVGMLITLDKGEAKWKEWFDKN